MSLLIIDSNILIINYRINKLKLHEYYGIHDAYLLKWMPESMNFFNVVIFNCKRLVFYFLNSIVLDFEKFVHVEIKFIFFT